MKLKSLIQRLDIGLLEIFLSRFRYRQLWVSQGLARWHYTAAREEQDLGQFSPQDIHWDKAEGWKMHSRLLPTVSEKSNKFPDWTQQEQWVLIPLQQTWIKPVQVFLCHWQLMEAASGGVARIYTIEDIAPGWWKQMSWAWFVFGVCEEAFQGEELVFTLRILPILMICDKHNPILTLISVHVLKAPRTFRSVGVYGDSCSFCATVSKLIIGRSQEAQTR